MARKKRDNLKKKAGQIFKHIDLAGEYTIELHQLFDGVHPDKAAALEVLGQTLLIAEKVLEAFTIECWSANKESCEKFTK